MEELENNTKMEEVGNDPRYVARTIYINPETYKLLGVISKLEGRSLAGLIRTILTDYVDNYRLTKEQLREMVTIKQVRRKNESKTNN